MVGAGLAGLSAGLRLAEAGYPVRIFERYPRPGGLARVFEVGGEPLEALRSQVGCAIVTGRLRVAQPRRVRGRVRRSLTA